MTLEEIVRHIDTEMFPNMDTTCRQEVEAALTASVKSGHFLVNVSDKRRTLAPISPHLSESMVPA